MQPIDSVIALRRFSERWLPLILWLAVMFAFSADSNPYRVLPGRWENACRAVGLGMLCQEEIVGRISHVAEFAVLALLANRALMWGKPIAAASLLLAAAACIAWALLDEIHQSFVPGRTFQILDLALDALGILLGSALFAWQRFFRRSGRPGTSAA